MSKILTYIAHLSIGLSAFAGVVEAASPEVVPAEFHAAAAIVLVVSNGLSVAVDAIRDETDK